MEAALAICGQIGSGKSTVSNFVVEEFGFRVVSFGHYVRHQLVQKDLPITRDSMQNAGDYLYQSLGAAGMVDGTLAHYGVHANSTVVFDGVRHSKVLTAIRQKTNKALAIYLDASRNERFSRCQKKQGHSLQFEDFKRIDGHPVESGIPDLAKLCDLKVDTSASIYDVQERLRNEIRRLISS